MIASRTPRSSAISTEISSQPIAAPAIVPSWPSERPQAQPETPQIPSAGAPPATLAAPTGGPAGPSNRSASGNRLQRLPNPNVQGCRVLLAEDNEVNQRLVSKLLQRVGVEVDIAENGQLAVERVRQQRYDLVLMDMQMPVLDGEGATRQIRGLGPRGRLPIVAISASVMPEDRQRCLAAGMNDFLAKPLKVEELYARLQQWIQPLPPADEPGEPPLPTIAGLDTDEGLQRTAGDRLLYLDLLRRLIDSEQDTPANIRTALAQGDLAKARRLTHTLKGLLGTVGAHAVMACAVELEQVLHGETPAPLEPALANLETRLAALLQALAACLGTPAEPTTPAVDQQQLAQICRKLAGYLAEDDAEAVSWFHHQSAPLRAAFADDYPRLADAIRSFAFEQAQALLQQLLAHHQSPTPEQTAT